MRWDRCRFQNGPMDKTCTLPRSLFLNGAYKVIFLFYAFACLKLQCPPRMRPAGLRHGPDVVFSHCRPQMQVGRRLPAVYPIGGDQLFTYCMESTTSLRRLQCRRRLRP